MGEMVWNEMERCLELTRTKNLGDFLGDAVVRHRGLVSHSVGGENPLRQLRRQMRRDRVDAPLQGRGCLVAIESDVLDAVDRRARLSQAVFASPARWHRVAAGSRGMLEPDEPLLRGGRG